MMGFAVQKVFHPADLIAHRIATAIVERMPEDGRSCHQVASQLSDTLHNTYSIETTVVHGSLHGIDHSWLRLPTGKILDPYRPGFHPCVLLIDPFAALEYKDQ